jgi:oxygen-independent coproporphyrinogen-3 oxidase
MSGVYIHIPFCTAKCSYCDFYSVANSSRINSFIKALLLEIGYKKKLFNNKLVSTIYFGGGTPSILNISQIKQILKKLHNSFNIIDDAEITIEANPNDLNPEFLKTLFDTEINRLSIGIQNFDDNILKFLRRKHNSQEALNSIKNAISAGFENISIDLIYGIPGLSNQMWQETLITALNLPIKHLSAYHLGIEKGTLLFKQLKNKKFEIFDENNSFTQFSILIDNCYQHGLEQYEISNFSKTKFKSKHNSSYWNHSEYIGFGPSAHSFYNNTRSYNVSNLLSYIEGITNKTTYFETEILSDADLHNEMIMLSLRTTKGLSIDKFKRNHGIESFTNLIKKTKEFDNKLFKFEDNHLRLTKKGLFVSDNIISSLFQ